MATVPTGTIRVTIFGHRGKVVYPIENDGWHTSQVGLFWVQVMKNYAGYHVYVDKGYCINDDVRVAVRKAARNLSVIVRRGLREAQHASIRFESKVKRRVPVGTITRKTNR